MAIVQGSLETKQDIRSMEGIKMAVLRKLSLKLGDLKFQMPDYTPWYFCRTGVDAEASACCFGSKAL